MSYTPIVFRSADSGNTAVGGTVSELLTNVLNPCLTIRAMYTADTDTVSNFVDNTTEARSNITGQTPYQLFKTSPSGTTNFNQDAAYFGATSRFDRLFLNFGVVGVANTAITLTWEYWNGSAWTTLTVTDGTSGLTANGVVTWTIPGSWTTKSVNSLTVYWVRVRYTAGSWTTRPTCNYSVITGWVKPFADSGDIGAFQQLGGNQIYLSVNDHGPGTARDARPLGYETMSALQTGTVPWPAVEAATMAWRKSTALDSATRSWMLWADDRTLYGFIITGDQSPSYIPFGFGDFYSYIPNDNFRNMIMGDQAETAGAMAASSPEMCRVETTLITTLSNFLNRGYTGIGGATAFGKHTDTVKSGGGNAIGAGSTSAMQYPNGTDGNLWLAPLWIHEAANLTIRGHLRGLWAPLANTTGFSDGDTFSGSGALSGKTFMVVKPTCGGGSAVGFVVLETSNTIDTN